LREACGARASGFGLPASGFRLPASGFDWNEFTAERIRKHFGEGTSMQMAITFMAVVAGMVFSLAVALLAEEFIFGQVFRLFFVRQSVRQSVPQFGRQTVAAKTEQKG
jgi:hypothetical protein